MTKPIRIESVTVSWHGRRVEIRLTSSGCDYRPVDWWPTDGWTEQFDEELGMTKLGIYLGNVYFGTGEE